ncbi:APC family permease [Bacillus sp. CGMCC 1.16541]|uniref:APC family permease n=1 Tax=Bacillus sp. CGMCC 1.16541 TaxID=2185143 RepID=UPI000D729D88|nr:APC family permease [Bacillus sp. CGMCC 1.16541]
MESRNELSKTLKPHWVWAIAFGSAIGWGAFVLPTDWIAESGPIGAIIGYIVGALLIMVIAFSYGFLVDKFPVSGGEFVYTYLSLGRIHAYICGWFVTLSYICSVALNATALIVLFKFLAPRVVEQGYMYTISGWDVYVSQIVLVTVALILFSYTNIRGASLAGKAQFIFSVTLLLGVILIALGMTFHRGTSFSNLQPSFNPEITPCASILIIVATAPWAYSGFNNIAQASEEFKFSSKKAFKLMILSLISGAGVYSLMVYSTAMGTPWRELVKGKPAWGTGDVAVDLFGNVGLVVLSSALCMGIFTGMNGFLVSSSRMLLSMGRAGILPKIFTNVHPTYNTPYVGIIAASLMSFLAPWFGREVLLWIVDMTATGIAIAYLYTCISAYKFYKWDQQFQQTFIALLGVLISLVFLCLLFIPASPAFLSLPSWIAFIAWIILGALFYLINGKKYRGIPKEKMNYLIVGKTNPEENIKGDQ